MGAVSRESAELCAELCAELLIENEAANNCRKQLGDFLAFSSSPLPLLPIGQTSGQAEQQAEVMPAVSLGLP